MTGFKINGASEHNDSPKSSAEILEMFIGYIKRETLKPIRGAGRWIVFGFVAALFVSIGMVLGAIGILRFFQAMILEGSAAWSWINYLIAMAFCVTVFFFTVSKIRKGSLEK